MKFSKLSPFFGIPFIFSLILSCVSLKAQTDEAPPGENTADKAIYDLFSESRLGIEPFR